MAHTEFVASVVIPARNEAETIEGCLRALVEQSCSPQLLEVIVVAAGDDGTGVVAEREGSGRFGRFEVMPLAAGNKNAALRAGCARTHSDVIVLLDADTALAPTAIVELMHALRQQPGAVVHGAVVPHVRTWVSRFLEAQHKLVKDLRFDGELRGPIIALPRQALEGEDLTALFPDRIGAADDLYLGYQLQLRRWRIEYAPAAWGVTVLPFTLRGFITTALRNRRGVIALLPPRAVAEQAVVSVVLILSGPLALALLPFSPVMSLVGAVPVLLLAGRWFVDVAALYHRRLGNYWRDLPGAIILDLLARALKLRACLDRWRGRAAPLSFRGERPDPRVAVHEA